MKKAASGGSRRKSAVRKMKAETLLSEARSALAEAFNNSRVSAESSVRDSSDQSDEESSPEMWAEARTGNTKVESDAAGSSMQ